MQTLKIDDLRDKQLIIHGALDIDQRPGGISPRRLPDWTRNQVPRFMDVMVRMPSGVRIIFETNSTSISITALTTNMVTPPAEKKPVVFDLEIDGNITSISTLKGNTILLDAHNPEKFELIRGEVTTLTFNNLSSENKRCELWLPQNAFIELQSLTIEDNASITKPVDGNKPSWLHYGSSISHCMEALQPSQIWPAVAARIAHASLHNLGFAGQCHLDPFIARVIRDSAADIISLKTGINIINMDSMRERIFKPMLHGFLDTIREGKPDTPITLISPIFCPSAENQPGPTIPNGNGKYVTLAGHQEIREGCMCLTKVRSLIAEVVDVRVDSNLRYFNGLDLFDENDAGDLPDDLHPNPPGYIRMGERFAEKHLNAMVANLMD